MKTITIDAMSLVGNTARFGKRRKNWLIEAVVKLVTSTEEGKTKKIAKLILTSPKSRLVHENETRELPIICDQINARIENEDSLRLFYEGRKSILIYIKQKEYELSFSC